MKKYIAEFIGTFVLTFMGCGAAVLSSSSLTIAVAFGLSIVAMAYSIGNISGCHINPAVSLAMFLSKKMDKNDFIGYVIAQVAGGIVAAAVLKLVFALSEAEVKVIGANGYGDESAIGLNAGGAIIVEILLTCIFVIAILGVTSKAEFSGVAGIVIGLTLTFVHIVGIPLTGTSVNPARSLGPALFSGSDAIAEVWVFILAPLVGAALAAYIYKFLAKED